MPEYLGHFFIQDSPGITRLVRQKPNLTVLANLTPGNDGFTQSGEDALYRLKPLTWDLEALGASPRYLLTLTLPNPAPLEQWRAAKGRYLSALSKRVSRAKGGLLWWQGFQRNGNPHLHVLVDPGSRKDWGEWLDWAQETWARALGQVIPPQAVDLQRLKHRDFRYVRSAHTQKQALAPYRAAWGRWWGIAGTWAVLAQEAAELSQTVELEPRAARAVALHLAERVELPAVAHRLTAFAQGQPSVPTIWIAKRLVSATKRTGVRA